LAIRATFQQKTYFLEKQCILKLFCDGIGGYTTNTSLFFSQKCLQNHNKDHSKHFVSTAVHLRSQRPLHVQGDAGHPG
jgi:hypothetical protein